MYNIATYYYNPRILKLERSIIIQIKLGLFFKKLETQGVTGWHSW